MDNPSPDPAPPSSTLSGEEEKPRARLPPVPRGRRGRPPGGATTSNRTLKSSLPRKRGRPPRSVQEAPLAAAAAAGGGGGGSSDLLLIDDQGVPYTVPEGSAADGPQGSGPRRAPHFCPVCLRAFPYLSDLERHSISHSELKPHECKDCGKTFKRSSHLRRHCNIHAGLRPFRCVLCPRRFREAGELAHHHRIHSGERPYQCPSCRVRFTEANTLRRHYKRKHPELVGMPVRLCPPNPRPQPLWDDDDDDEEGVPVAERVQEESPEGKGPASPLPGFTAGSSAAAGRGQGGQDTLISGDVSITEGGQKQGPRPLGPDAVQHPPAD
ncbi:zinc finger protein 524 isoform X1 [Cricetulus griseus]|uniref:Zinc finger protein 524 n=1 Tax=Cricetulus griseus TaxID=10029 RepID=A0A061HUP2_CRIGR|nr:zinc finger protein 524 isoform X2 [Cricetulus griseus]XP_035305281.1 zinc finger protein 524 isoform X2 [Cricetulus griseus]XP_035315592.1 zinc finger protein 524 isoform X1 [Cricetulus griseus]ERE47848.1 zinc finger protein [Cricetulus griseus]